MCVVGVSWHWACCPGVLPQSKTTDLDCKQTKSATSPDTSQMFVFEMRQVCLGTKHAVLDYCQNAWWLQHTYDKHASRCAAQRHSRGGQAAVCSAQWSASCMLSCCPCSKPVVDDLVPRGLEPRTLRLLAVRSDQLSYETS